LNEECTRPAFTNQLSWANDESKKRNKTIINDIFMINTLLANVNT